MECHRDSSITHHQSSILFKSLQDSRAPYGDHFNGWIVYACLLMVMYLFLIPTGAVAAGQGYADSLGAKTAESVRKSNGLDETIVRGRILVSPRPGLPANAFAEILNEHQGKARKIGQSNLYIVELPEYAEEGAIARLIHHPHLKYAELDRIVSPGSIPNDPMFVDQWYLPKIGVTTAWDTTQGNGVVVAVLDSGANSQHPDLVGQLVPGWNVYDNNSDTTDLTGHGTHVTGTVVASSNNGIGVASVAGQSKVMPVRITEPVGGGTSYSNLATGIVYAADHGARIANASFLNVMGSSLTLDAAQYMKNKNGLVIVGAGNTARQEYFAETPTMIQVSATDESDSLAVFSSFGTYVDLAAPGMYIVTTNKDGGYSTVHGTSFATPIAAGVLALMMSANPALTNLDIENLIFSTAADLGDPGKDVVYGYGRVDAARAVQAALVATPTVDVEAPVVTIIDPLSGETLAGLVPVDVQATDNVTVVRTELWVNGTNIATDTSPPFAFTWDSTGVANGASYLVAVAFDSAGNKSTSSIDVNVSNPVPPPAADTTPPSVAIINPVAGNVSGSVTISVDASDNSGAAGISQSIYIDGNLVATGSGSTLAYTWNTRSKKVSAGSHTIKAVAKDAAGNTASTSVTVKVVK